MTSVRETTRDAITTILAAEVAGASNPAQIVFGSTTADLRGQLPAIVLQSAGVNRKGWNAVCWEVEFFYRCWIFVPYLRDGWTTANANDLLDEIEEAIATALKTYRVTDNWQDIRYDAPTKVEEVAFGGASYLMEEIYLKARVRGDSSNNEEL